MTDEHPREGRDRHGPVEPMALLGAIDASVLRHAVETSTDCIKVLDLDGNLESMNAGGMCTMEIDDFAPFQGACWPDLWRGEEAAKVEAALDAARAGGVGRFQGRTATAKGNVRLWDVVVSPVPGRDGRPERLLAVSRDITASSDAEAELERLLGEQALARRQAAEREELFRTVFEQAPDDAIVVMDEARRITAWNPAAERIMQWTPEEAMGELADMFFTPEDRARGMAAKEILGAAVNGKTPDERWHLRRDGSRFWGSGTMNSLHDEGGAVRGYLKVFRDATERHEAQAERERLLAELEVERARLRTFFQLAPAFLCVLRGRDLVFEYVNQAYYGIVGHRPLLGLPLARAIPEAAGGGEGRDYDRLLLGIVEGGRPQTFRARPVVVQRERGGPLEERFLDLAYIPLPQADGEEAGVLVHGIDVTDQVLARAEMAALNEGLEARVAERTQELERAVREAEGFNYSISHDLRTPLRAISSTASVLLEDLGPELGEAHRALLARQSRNATRMGTLIDDLLRLSRLSRAEVRRERVDVAAMAGSVARGIEGPCVVEAQEGMAADADPSLLRTVLQNLVGNACKFSPNGGTVSVGEDGGTFWVRDEGIGFDPAHAARIFMPFERLVADHEFPGTGIGLANVKRIVERHGGRVWFESEPGKGATFFFTLG